MWQLHWPGGTASWCAQRKRRTEVNKRAQRLPEVAKEWCKKEKYGAALIRCTVFLFSHHSRRLHAVFLFLSLILLTATQITIVIIISGNVLPTIISTRINSL